MWSRHACSLWFYRTNHQSKDTLWPNKWDFFCFVATLFKNLIVLDIFFFLWKLGIDPRTTNIYCTNIWKENIKWNKVIFFLIKSEINKTGFSDHFLLTCFIVTLWILVFENVVPHYITWQNNDDVYDDMMITWMVGMKNRNLPIILKLFGVWIYLNQPLYLYTLILILSNNDICTIILE